MIEEAGIGLNGRRFSFGPGRVVNLIVGEVQVKGKNLALANLVEGSRLSDWHTSVGMPRSSPRREELKPRECRRIPDVPADHPLDVFGDIGGNLFDGRAPITVQDAIVETA